MEKEKGHLITNRTTTTTIAYASVALLCWLNLNIEKIQEMALKKVRQFTMASHKSDDNHFQMENANVY
jgi:hypothetical protein